MPWPPSGAATVRRIRGRFRNQILFCPADGRVQIPGSTCEFPGTVWTRPAAAVAEPFRNSRLVRRMAEQCAATGNGLQLSLGFDLEAFVGYDIATLKNKRAK